MFVRMIFFENPVVNRSILYVRSGRRLLRGSSSGSTQIPGVCTHVVSGFSDGGGLHLRISGFQIRKRYHNQQSAHRQGRKHIQEGYVFPKHQRGNRSRGKQPKELSTSSLYSYFVLVPHRTNTFRFIYRAFMCSTSGLINGPTHLRSIETHKHLVLQLNKTVSDRITYEAG